MRKNVSKISCKIYIDTIYHIEKEGQKPEFVNDDLIALVLEKPVKFLFPLYCRCSPLPGWKDIMYLRSCGCDVSAYRVLMEFLKKQQQQG